MSKDKKSQLGKKAVIAEEAGLSGAITVRPFQFEYNVICQIEKDGVIVDTAKASDKIMEVNFNGATLQGMIAAARQALEQKYNGG